MSETVGTPDVIAEVARKVVSEPLGHLKAAHQYLDQDCVMHPLAFGALFSGLVSSDYAQARTLHSDNLAAGEEVIQGMGDGLAVVAANLSHADHASNPTGRALPDGEGYHPVPATDDNWDNKLGVGVVLEELSLAGSALVVSELTEAAATAAWTAVAGAIGWLLVIPDDAELSKAQGGWEAAAHQVGQIDMARALARLGEPQVWGGPSREAFNGWLGGLTEGLESAQAGMEANVAILESLFHLLNHFEQEAFTKSLEALVEILVCTALAEVPYVGPVFEASALALGALLSVAIWEIIQAMYESIEATHHQLLQTVGPLGSFAGLKVDAAGRAVSLTDIRVEWDDQDANDLGARRDHHD